MPAMLRQKRELPVMLAPTAILAPLLWQARVAVAGPVRVAAAQCALLQAEMEEEQEEEQAVATRRRTGGRYGFRTKSGDSTRRGLPASTTAGAVAGEMAATTTIGRPAGKAVVVVEVEAAAGQNEKGRRTGNW